MSSVRKGSVLRRGPDGTWGALLPPGTPGVWSVLALALDEARGTLWATTAALPQLEGLRPEDKGRTALLALSLADGAVLRRLELDAAGAPRALGELLVGPDGTVYASDGLRGEVWRLRPGGAALEPIGGPAEFQSAQGMALLPGGDRLLVADYLRGLAAIDLRTQRVEWLDHSPDQALSGLDGLVALPDGAFAAVQNGPQPPRILLLRLDRKARRVRSAEVLARGAPLGDPTHCAPAGDGLLCLVHSGWEAFPDDGTVKDGGPREPARLVRVAIPRAPARP